MYVTVTIVINVVQNSLNAILLSAVKNHGKGRLGKMRGAGPNQKRVRANLAKDLLSLVGTMRIELVPNHLQS